MAKVFLSKDARQTRSIGAALGRKILAKAKSEKRGRATVLGLLGELGSGKTTFLQGFAWGLGVKAKTKSPTFLLIRSFPAKQGFRFWHLDCYRLKSAREIKKLGLEQILKEPRHIVAVEWAERIKKLLPRNTIWIHFQCGKQPNERRISVSINL